MLPHWPAQIQSFILPWIVRRLTHPFTYIMHRIPCFSPAGVLSFPCNPHHQQNKWDSPVLYGCANKVAPYLMSFLHFVLVLLSAHGIFDGKWWFSTVEDLNYHRSKITKRELLHLSDGSHHQVLRWAVIQELQGFRSTKRLGVFARPW